MISKSLSTSERFASLVEVAGGLAEFCQALYPLVVAHSDDFGRLQGDAFTVKHMCFPASPRSLEDFSTALRLLDAVGLTFWYGVAGKRYLQIAQFETHQQGLHRRTRSAFPRVPGSSGNDEEMPGQLKGREEKRTEEKNVPRAQAPASDAERLTDAFRAKWRAAYGVDCSLLLRPMEYSNLAQQLDAVGPVRLMAAMTAYFATEDTYIRKARHPLALFLREPLKYLAGEAVATGPPKGCRHQPPCRDDAEHTKRDIADRRAS